MSEKIVLEITDQLLRDMCKQFLSYAYVADELKIKRPSVYNVVKRYKLTPFIIAGTFYLSRENVEMIKRERNHGRK
jgi:predicted DNA-binding protein YlxM (UPF0122 family)